MQPEMFHGCNAVLRPPENQDGISLVVVGEVPLQVGLNGAVSQWRPTAAEVDILSRGGAIRLYMLGGSLPGAILMETVEP